MPIPVALLERPSPGQRVLTLLQPPPTGAFSLLETIEAVQLIPAHQIELVVGSKQARGIKGPLDRYEGVLEEVQHGPASGCPVVCGENGGVRYFAPRARLSAEDGK